MKAMKTTLMMASAALSLLALTACSSGGSSSPAPAPTSTTTTSTNPYAAVCANLTGCVTVANGFNFPDGTGGTISCVSGKCTDATATTAAYNSGYSAGDAAGQSTTVTQAYNNGYSAGSSASTTTAYNNGYSAGTTAGYNSGYSDGQTAGYNTGYSDGQTAGYNSGYSAGDTAGYNSGYSDGYNVGYSDGQAGLSVIGSTKDTDLQKSQAQQMSLEDRASAISQQMGMSADSAMQMVQLTDQVQQMALAGQMTAADRMAIANSALKIAGVSTDEVDTAIASAMKGDMGAANDLMDKAAKNLGMASGADVRDKLIPTLGLVMP